ncbi:MAG: inositol monophosphatase [Chloroflexi bacterium]|nr:inositol monophosphatase [Chloroflexota bacterium]
MYRRPPFEDRLQEIERLAIDAATSAAAFVGSRFGGTLDVSRKAHESNTLVTDVDLASQKMITELVASRFPDHRVLGEEDKVESEPPATEYVWAVDPIDGTTNFVNELPIYAVSVGVLHRGRPVAGACALPWPGESRPIVLHARLGGGAWLGERKLWINTPPPSAPSASEAGSPGSPAVGAAPSSPATAGSPVSPKVAAGSPGARGEGARAGGAREGRISAIPGSIRRGYRLNKEFIRNIGEPRQSGSAVYDQVLVAMGIAQYAIAGPARVWDFAAGVLLVREAGGIAMTPTDPRSGRFSTTWRPLESFVDGYETNSETFKRLRAWHGPVLLGPPSVVEFVARNVRPRRPSRFRRLRRMLFRRKRRGPATS